MGVPYTQKNMVITEILPARRKQGSKRFDPRLPPPLSCKERNFGLEKWGVSYIRGNLYTEKYGIYVPRGT